jgi:stearoyl-CoA desaturase (delta-9 desaturase)
MYAGLVDWPWWAYVLVTLGLTHVTIAAVTIFLHRHQAHRALDLHPLPAHFFRLWLWLTTGMGTKEWAAIHRKHHAKVETPEDPHSPQIYGINRVLWAGVFLYVKEAHNAETLARYGHGTPDDWIEKRLYTPCQKLGVVVMLGIDVALFGSLAGLAMWAAQVAWIPFWAAGVVNGLGHFWGYRNFNSPDASKNIFPLGILIGGEELHNNHHTYATSAKLSNKWYEFDLGWMYIRILAALGLAQVKKLAPVPHLGALRATVDFDTLQAVIANRYDVLAGYAKSLKKMYRQELAKRHNRQQFKGLKRCLTGNASAVPEALRGRLDQLLKQSSALQTAYAMREELMGLWARTNSSREQLIKDLQDWCQRAENSGVEQLQQLSLRLRSYSLS